MSPRHRSPAVALALGLALALAGCSGGTGSKPLYPQIAAAAAGAVGARAARRQAANRPPLTRAALDAVEGAFIEVTVEQRPATAYLFLSAERDDALPGHIVQWRTEDDVTLTLRNDVLIATRGLGGDVVSSAVNVAPGVAGPAAGGPKLLDIRDGDLQIRRLRLLCELRDLGPAPVEIVERRHPTRHLRERCGGAPEGEVVNDYWVDAGAGIVWQSRQWAGPHVGYLRIRRLTR